MPDNAANASRLVLLQAEAALSARRPPDPLGGAFGRTLYSLASYRRTIRRDHHPRLLNRWAAGGGIKGGTVLGDRLFQLNIVENPVHVRDLHATLLQLLGFDHHRLTFKWQGLDAKLTGVEPAKVVKDLLA